MDQNCFYIQEGLCILHLPFTATAENVFNIASHISLGMKWRWKISFTWNKSNSTDAVRVENKEMQQQKQIKPRTSERAYVNITKLAFAYMGFLMHV